MAVYYSEAEAIDAIKAMGFEPKQVHVGLWRKNCTTQGSLSDAAVRLWRLSACL
jgi:hypothetical protein